MRDVSETSMLEDSSPTPTVEPAETQASDPADVPTPEATTREQKAAKTETQDSEPTTTPEPPDTGGDGTEPVPDPGPPLPTMKRCFNEHGEIPCSYASS